MRRLSHYTFRSVFGAVLMVLFIMVSLDAVFAFLDQVGEIEGGYTLFEVFVYVVFTLPSRVYDFIPDSSLIGCLIGLGLRVLPGMDSDALVGRIKEAVEIAASGFDFEFQVLNDSPPFCVGEDAEIYKAVCELVNQSQTFGVTYASDAGHLSTLGIDCVLFGPGTIEVAHKPNEFIPIDEFNNAKPLLKQLVHQFCED